MVTFWNAEGVALRERGVRTREFRVDEFGAPRYPELVRGGDPRDAATSAASWCDDLVGALAEGTEAALRDRRRGRARDRGGVRRRTSRWCEAQLEAVAPALRPPLELDMAQLRRWARFDERFGILRRAPDVERAFAP